MNYEWSEEDPLVLIIDEQIINLDTKGIDYARQFGNLTSWLGKYALPALMSAAETGQLESESDYATVVTLLTNLMDYGFSPESMIELASILINKDKKFVEEYFDPGWFVEALLRSYDHRPGVRVAFMRLYERFFLAAPADEGDGEG